MVGTMKLRQCFFVDLVFVFVFVKLLYLFLAALWLATEKEINSWLSFMLCFCVLCQFPIRCPRSGGDTCLCRFMIFAFLLILLTSVNDSVISPFLPFCENCESFWLFVFRVCLPYCLVNSLQLCGHLLGKAWPLSSLDCDVFLCFCHFPIWYPGLAAVLDCIDF